MLIIDLIKKPFASVCKVNTRKSPQCAVVYFVKVVHAVKMFMHGGAVNLLESHAWFQPDEETGNFS